MQNVFTFPDGRNFALCYAQIPLGANRQDTPLRSPQDLDQLMAYLGNAKIASIWRDYYLEQASSQRASPTAPLSEMRKRIKEDLWKGRLYFIPRDDPEDKPENIDQAIRTARTSLQMHLRTIIQDEQKEKAKLAADYEKLSAVEKAAFSAKKAATGLGKAAKDFLIWANDIADVADVNRRAIRIVDAAKKTYWEQNKKSWGENLAQAEYKEIIEVLGFDPAKITRAQVEEAYELANLIWSDIETRNILKQFSIDYAKAQHHTEWTEMAGGLAFEVILTLLIAALTGGAGAVAVVAKNMSLMTKLQKAGQALLEIGKKLKKLKARVKQKLIKVKESMSSSGTSPKSKYDKVDEVMHQAGGQKQNNISDKVNPVGDPAKDKQQIAKLSSQGNIIEARKILQPHVDAAKTAKTPEEKRLAMEAILSRLDVDSPKEKIFWSGDKQKAAEYAEKHGKTILEQTPGGKVADGWKDLNDTFSWNKDDMPPHGWDLWGGISKKYADGAKGNIETIQTAAKFPAGGPTWKDKEWPSLRKNPEVGNITIHKIDELGNIVESLTVDSKSSAALTIFGAPSL